MPGPRHRADRRSVVPQCDRRDGVYRTCLESVVALHRRSPPSRHLVHRRGRGCRWAPVNRPEVHMAVPRRASPARRTDVCSTLAPEDVRMPSWLSCCRRQPLIVAVILLLSAFFAPANAGTTGNLSGYVVTGVDTPVAGAKVTAASPI